MFDNWYVSFFVYQNGEIDGEIFSGSLDLIKESELKIFNNMRHSTELNEYEKPVSMFIYKIPENFEFAICGPVRKGDINV